MHVAAAPKLLRTRKMADKRATRAVAKDPDAVRARRSTANRLWTILKAALNHTFHESKVASDEPFWPSSCKATCRGLPAFEIRTEMAPASRLKSETRIRVSSP